MSGKHKLASKIFLVAGIYGLIALLPQYFMEQTLNRNFPPPLTHPESFYGFIGVAIAWQFAFFVIARDVQRFRLFILTAVLEKIAFRTAVFVLHAQGRVALLPVLAGSIDLLLAALFVLAFFAARNDGDGSFLYGNWTR